MDHIRDMGAGFGVPLLIPRHSHNVEAVPEETCCDAPAQQTEADNTDFFDIAHKQGPRDRGTAVD